MKNKKRKYLKYKMPPKKFITIEQKEFDKIDDNRKINISCHELGYENVIVQTTHGQIKDMFKSCEEQSKEKNIHILLQAKENIKVNIDEVYNHEQKWQDFCDDVAIYFSMRQYIFKQPIPIINVNPRFQPEEHKRETLIEIKTCSLCDNLTTNACSKCGTLYCSIECQKKDWTLHKKICK